MNPIPPPASAHWQTHLSRVGRCRPAPGVSPLLERWRRRPLDRIQTLSRPGRDDSRDRAA